MKQLPLKAGLRSDAYRATLFSVQNTVTAREGKPDTKALLFMALYFILFPYISCVFLGTTGSTEERQK